MTQATNIRLTEFSRGAGCGCKIAPDILQKIISGNNKENNFSGLLVGNSSNDDAAVFDLGNDMALISTTDFFTPVVDDAFDFGRIAATNAISDVYAMGGTPTLALAILGWPVEKLPAELAAKVLEGAKEICAEANIPLAGGHSIDSAEPIFGLSVNGLVSKKNLKKNNTAQSGDLIFLTKPIGTGILSSALKRNEIKEDDKVLLIKWMTTLNKSGAELGKHNFISALTDVTGFGLAGHFTEMAEGSNLSAEIYFDKIPFITNLDFYLDKFIYPDMTMKVYSSLSNKISELNPKQLFTLCDPQTSGGLMIAVKSESEKEFISLMKTLNTEEIFLQPIGKFTARKEKIIEVK